MLPCLAVLRPAQRGAEKHEVWGKTCNVQGAAIEQFSKTVCGTQRELHLVPIFLMYRLCYLCCEWLLSPGVIMVVNNFLSVLKQKHMLNRDESANLILFWGPTNASLWRIIDSSIKNLNFWRILRFFLLYAHGCFIHAQYVYKCICDCMYLILKLEYRSFAYICNM